MPDLPTWLTPPIILSIASIVIALLLPEWRRWRDRRDALKGYVTLAFLAHRFTNLVFYNRLGNVVMGDVTTDFIICRRAIEAVELKLVRPAELSEQFLEIAHCLERANQAYRGELDDVTAEHFRQRSIIAMARLFRKKNRLMSNQTALVRAKDGMARPSEPPQLLAETTKAAPDEPGRPR